MRLWCSVQRNPLDHGWGRRIHWLLCEVKRATWRLDMPCESTFGLKSFEANLEESSLSLHRTRFIPAFKDARLNIDQENSYGIGLIAPLDQRPPHLLWARNFDPPVNSRQISRARQADRRLRLRCFALRVAGFQRELRWGVLSCTSCLGISLWGRRSNALRLARRV
jgi:hypothetical protein